MAWTTPRTWVVGETVTAALLNTHLRDNLSTLRGLNDYACKLYRTSDQAINNDVVTVVTWQAAVYNVGTLWAVGNPSRLPAPVTGYYALSAVLGWDTNGTGARVVGYQKNGVATTYQMSGYASPSSYSYNHAYEEIDLTAGDYIEVTARQNSGGSLNLESAADNTRVTWRLLGT